MQNLICVENEMVLNLDNVTHIDLRQLEDGSHTSAVRVWFACAEDGSRNQYRDFTGTPAEAIRHYARTGMMNAYRDRLESATTATFQAARTAGAGAA